MSINAPTASNTEANAVRTTDIMEFLDQHRIGILADIYNPAREALEAFQASSYPDTPEGTQDCVLHLLRVTLQLREADRLAQERLNRDAGFS